MGIYQAALGLLMPLVWRYFGRRGAKDPAYLEHWEERKGKGADFASDVWIHAVSLGEFRSAEPLIRLLLSEGKRLVITHATPAGRQASEAALAEAIANGQVAIRYAPVDRISYWRRFFEATQPRAGAVMEMEFWAGMTEAARQSGVALWFANAQIPAKSYPRAVAWRRLLGSHPAARGHGVLAKSERMADRFRSLGAQRVEVIGETRFDIALPQHHLVAGENLKAALGDRSIFTFASVVAGEEEVYLKACHKLTATGRSPFIIWGPRAPELFDASFDLLRASGFFVARRSVDLAADLSLVGDLAETDILLGDSFGEMFFYLSTADAVSVGGGFTEKGAHNVIEPLAVGKPVATGPEIWPIEYPGVEAEEAGLLMTVADGDELAEALMGLAEATMPGAEAFHAANSGASERVFDTIKRYLDEARV